MMMDDDCTSTHCARPRTRTHACTHTREWRGLYGDVLLHAPSDGDLGGRTAELGGDGLHSLVLEQWHHALDGLGRAERTVGRQRDPYHARTNERMHVTGQRVSSRRGRATEAETRER
jgi:hypothetical protein